MRKIAVLFLVSSLFFVPSFALAQESGSGDAPPAIPAATADDGQAAEGFDDATILRRFERSLFRSFRAYGEYRPVSDSILIAVPAGAAYGLFRSGIDDEAAEYFRGVEIATSDFGNRFGSAEVLLPSIIGTMIIADTVGANQVADCSERMLASHVQTKIVTQITKRVAGRLRPNGENNRSFFSGHASTTASLAVVAWGCAGWKVGIPATVAAVATSAARLDDGHHYPSDVFMGAFAGIVVTGMVERLYGRSEDAGLSTYMETEPVILFDQPIDVRRSVGLRYVW